MDHPQASAAVLTSGGLDSAILLAEASRLPGTLWPIYVRTGLAWEAVELDHLRRFLATIDGSALQPLTILDMPVGDLYGNHWSITGQDVPDESSADEAVYLPGRNVLLLAKAMLWCHLHQVERLALGILSANPFPDATPGFFADFEQAVNRAVDGRVEINRPFAGRSKSEVMRLGEGLPLELTFSCIRPLAGRHCGRCNKCGERRRAFASVHRPDPTEYFSEGPCTA
jgi:7-cyano-7-deazaguanine synthase